MYMQRTYFLLQRKPPEPSPPHPPPPDPPLSPQSVPSKLFEKPPFGKQGSIMSNMWSPSKNPSKAFEKPALEKQVHL